MTSAVIYEKMVSMNVPRDVNWHLQILLLKLQQIDLIIWVRSLG